MRFKIDWASLIVGSKFTVFALFYFVFEGNFPSTSPRGAYIWRGDLTEGFLRYRFGGLHGGAYFRNFTVYRDQSGKVVCGYQGLKIKKSLLENGRKTSTSLTVCYAFRPKLERYCVVMLK